MIAVVSILATVTQANAGCTAAQREPYESVIAQIEQMMAGIESVKPYLTKEQYNEKMAKAAGPLLAYKRKIALMCGENSHGTCSDETRRAFDQRIFALQQMAAQYTASQNESVDEFASYADINRTIQKLESEKAKACYGSRGGR